MGRMGIREKVKTTYRLTSWFLGSVSFFTLIPSLIIKQTYSQYLIPFFVLDTIILFAVYQIGLEMNFAKVGKKQRICEHIKIFFVSPILWFLEAIPMVLYFFKRAPKFYVIEK